MVEFDEYGETRRIAVLNLTQHAATQDQLQDGVVDLPNKEELVSLLTFDNIPCVADLQYRADQIALLAKGYKFAMIGGAPFFMSFLEQSLKFVDVEPVYAFSKRESQEQVQDDGSVKKVNVFRHVGFVRV